MDVYERMKELGIELPKAPEKGGIYAPAKEFGENLVYVSGCGPLMGTPVSGKVGQDITKEEAKGYARNCMMNVLAVLERQIGDLNRVKRAVKILVFVASDDTFDQQPYVANGGSELLAAVFGDEAGTPSRSAIGVNVLPGNIPVEIEALFEITGEA